MAANKDFALVVGGVVETMARFPVGPEAFGDAPQGDVVEFDVNTAAPSMLWDGQTLSAPPPPAPTNLVPRSVSMRQARLALLGAGLLSQVNSLIAVQPQAVQIEWEFASDVWRDRDLVKTLSVALGLSDPQIDALFIAAKAIP